MFASIVNTFLNCFKIPELKSRILFTLFVLGVCRLEAYIRVPGLNGDALKRFFEAQGSGNGGVLGVYSLFTGGALENCALGALGIMPYISATIVLQLLTAIVPSLSKQAREEGGRVKIIKWSRYLTVLLCLAYGFGMAIGWENPSSVPGFGGFQGSLVLYDNIWWYRIQTVIILTTGTMLLMWLGEQITERGIGNGVSLIITIGILARLPMAGQSLLDMFHPASGEAQFNYGHAILLCGLLALVVGGVIAVTQSQRKIPVQYAQRAVGRKMMQGGSSYLPLKLNFSGVMPIIFAQAILMIPQRFFQSIGVTYHIKLFTWIGNVLNEGETWYFVIYTLMILFFSYFWTATQFNELQIADDLKKNGGYIPGVRPGQATADFLHNSMSRITLAGAVFLTIIAVIPVVLAKKLHVPYGVATFFGGTSMLIMVGVLLDTMRQMQTHLLNRHYDGFFKAGRSGSGGPRNRGAF